MKICQISPYGGEPKWQHLGLKLTSDLKWLILLSNKPSVEEKNFLAEANDLREELDRNQLGFPEAQKIRLNVLDLTSITENYHELIGCFHQMFSLIISQNYIIQINATSGLTLWQMTLFQVAMFFKEHVNSFFIFNKLTGDPIKMWRPVDLNDAEKDVLNIIKNSQTLNLSDLLKQFQILTSKGSLSYMAKIINKLSVHGYINEAKEGREKLVSLSDLGKAITGTKKYSEILNSIKNQ